MINAEAKLPDDFDPLDVSLDRTESLITEASRFVCNRDGQSLVAARRLIERLVEDLVKYRMVVGAWLAAAEDDSGSGKPLEDVMAELEQADG